MDEKQNNIILENRTNMNVSGVERVDSFTETTVVLFTSLGVMSIKGENLHICDFSVETGDLTLEGKVKSINYSDELGKKGNFFAGLFR